MTTERLISADSHVAVRVEALRERVPTDSQQIVDRQFADVPDAERELICSGNAARIYGL
jgi:hypothetical protein